MKDKPVVRAKPYPRIWCFDDAEPYQGLAAYVHDGTRRVHTRQEWEELKAKIDAFYDSISDAEIDCYNSVMMREREKELAKLMAPRGKKDNGLSGIGNAGYVYIIQSQEHYKIGRSRNPENRVKSYSSLPGIKLLHYFPADNMNKAEKELHRRYSQQRVGGEWFELHPANVEYLCSIKEYKNGDFW